MSSSPDETAPLFDISGLHYRYAGAQVDALADLELEVHAGEFVAVVGANGSGKSTLARLIGGLEKPAAATWACCSRTPRTSSWRSASKTTSPSASRTWRGRPRTSAAGSTRCWRLSLIH